jgi:hypothetical protein
MAAYAAAYRGSNRTTNNGGSSHRVDRSMTTASLHPLHDNGSSQRRAVVGTYAAPRSALLARMRDQFDQNRHRARLRLGRLTTNARMLGRLDVAHALRARVQTIEQTHSLEHLADPRIRVHDSKRATAGRRDVIRANQLTYPGCIDPRHTAEVEHDPALSPTKTPSNHLRQFSGARRLVNPAQPVQFVAHLLTRLAAGLLCRPVPSAASRPSLVDRTTWRVFDTRSRAWRHSLAMGLSSEPTHVQRTQSSYRCLDATDSRAVTSAAMPLANALHPVYTPSRALPTTLTGRLPFPHDFGAAGRYSSRQR